MKKYFLGITAVLLATVISAFNSNPYSTQTFKLINCPTSVSAFTNPANWRTDGINYLNGGICGSSNNEVACTIAINDAVAGANDYFHIEDFGDGPIKVLNSQAYAESQTPQKKYFTINQTNGIVIGCYTYLKFPPLSIVPSGSLNSTAFSTLNGDYNEE